MKEELNKCWMRVKGLIYMRRESIKLEMNGEVYI